MAEHPGQPLRKRARLACVACNARRVKCNVTESRPCLNCVAGNIPCETRASRRGKHVRKPKSAEASEQLRAIAKIDRGSDTDTPTTPRHHDDELVASHALASQSSHLQEPGADQASHVAFDQTSLSVADSSPGIDAPRSSIDQAEQEDDGAVFLGESNSLRYIPNEQTPTVPFPRRPRLRHSIPNAAKADALIPGWETERRRSRFKALQAGGAFSFPSISIRESLLRAYFTWFHPHFAIVDEPDVWRLHRAGTISPLLLQAMLFIGVIHSDDATLDSLDWGSRHRAKYLFYTRAKDLYDAEYETRKLTVIQALFLMSFWRAGALLEKDVRHWLGAAISLAQTKALHRSAGDLEPHVASLRRRIWWSIYIRERQCGSSLGLPNRIRDEDCDVEPLSQVDFQPAYNRPKSDVDRFAKYMIRMTELSQALGKIVDAGYLPNRTLDSSDRSQIREKLLKWKQELPPVMQLSDDSGQRPSFQASMLHLAYNNLLILLHRSAFISNGDRSGRNDGNIALQAAVRNSRIVEDMLPEGNLGHAQIHVITNLFNTLCIHVAHLRRSSGINRTIAEHRAKLCLLGLQELQRTWEVTNWVLQLFFQYLDRTTAARLEMEADDAGITSPAKQGAADSNAQPIFPSLNQLTQVDSRTANRDSDDAMITNEHDTTTPWSWTTDEANQYLFSQIENDFAFGEGGMLQGSPHEAFDGNRNILPDLIHSNLSIMP